MPVTFDAGIGSDTADEANDALWVAEANAASSIRSIISTSHEESGRPVR